ncbi:MAG: calcium/sodium antiporter [Dinoroseobacter sp.]|nr:calcium/sodium antiporter [Dinoroseobacter sp.]
MDFVVAALGLVILVLAGDSLVKGAVNLALRVGIPALIVSLTIVAFGTSAPELLVSIAAIEDGAPGLALGNVVGSNIANILLVLGVPAMIATIHTNASDTRRSFTQMIAATALFIVICFLGPITWIHGTVLLAALAWMLSDALRQARAHRAAANGQAAEEEEEPEGADPDMPWWKIILFLALGLIGLPLGADLLVDSSVSIARAFGISEEVIGLTLVAFGTSLPELATVVMAAIRGQADVALGNVIGSNMFNLLAIIGVASFVGSIPVADEFLHLDLWVMAAVSVLLLPFAFQKLDITRPVGAVLTALYGVYVVSLLH